LLSRSLKKTLRLASFSPEQLPLRYLFETYALDTDRRELRRGAQVVPVEPQVFDGLPGAQP
jgi:hypothetical protein